MKKTIAICQRFPASLVERAEQIARASSARTGVPVERAHVVRAAFERGLDLLDHQLSEVPHDAA